MSSPSKTNPAKKTKNPKSESETIYKFKYSNYKSKMPLDCLPKTQKHSVSLSGGRKVVWIRPEVVSALLLLGFFRFVSPLRTTSTAVLPNFNYPLSQPVAGRAVETECQPNMHLLYCYSLLALHKSTQCQTIA